MNFLHRKLIPANRKTHMNALKPANRLANWLGCVAVLLAFPHAHAAPPVTPAANSFQIPRVIVTSDGEIDDQCSMVRFLLYANELDIEGIVTSSSQYHGQGHSWPGNDWIEPYQSGCGPWAAAGGPPVWDAFSTAASGIAGSVTVIRLKPAALANCFPPDQVENPTPCP